MGQTLGLASHSQSAARVDVEQAFRDACETQLQPVYLYVRYRAGRAAADDLAAQVFLKAWARLDTFAAVKGDMHTWLFGVARNVVRDHLRAARRWKWRPVEWLSHRTSAGPDPEQAVLDDERRRHLTGALSTLSDRERDVMAPPDGPSNASFYEATRCQAPGDLHTFEQAPAGAGSSRAEESAEAAPK